jgi:hypothetical protein
VTNNSGLYTARKKAGRYKYEDKFVLFLSAALQY